MTKPKTTQEDIQAARADRTKNFFGKMAKLYAENGGTGNGLQSIEPIESDRQPRPQYLEDREGISLPYDLEEGVGPKPEGMSQDVYDKIVSAHESAQATGDMFERMMEETIAEKEKEKRPKVGSAKVTAGERPRHFASWETEGMSNEELKQIGAHPSKQRTLAPMDVDAKTVSKPGGMTDEERDAELGEAAEALQRQRDAQAKARGQDGEAPQPDLPPDTEPEPEPHDPDESLDEARNYQGKYIGYPNDPKAPKADLEKWKNRGDSWGAHDDYEGTGYDLITIDTPDDPDGVPKRQFLEDPETGEVINITGMLPPDTDEHTTD